MGIVGLGRMGAGIRDRLREAGHEVIGYDADPDRSDVASIADLVDALEPPRVAWVMVPAGEPTESSVRALGDLLDAGDVIVEGGNSHYRDSMRRGVALGEHGIAFVDAGISGGIWGLQEGFCVMAGGTDDAIERVEPLFRALAPPEGYA